jgi:predicted SAM-dependent methyltransferase
MISLDLGCGKRKKKGCIGIDKIQTDAVDVVAELEHGIPFKDDSVDEIYCIHFLQHTELVPMMEEIHRVLKAGGILHVVVPYYTCKDFFTDPTHKTAFTEHTFRKYFTAEEPLNYYTKARFEELKVKFNYSAIGRWIPIRRILRHYLFNIVDSLYFKLRAVKGGNTHDSSCK